MSNGTKETTRVHISKSDRPIYDKLKYSDGPFKGRKNKEIFIMAVALGYKAGTRKKITPPREPYDEIDNFSTEQKSIIKAIAVAEENMEILSNPAKVYCIAEEYAVTGIKILDGMVNSTEYDFSKKLESILVEEYDKQKMGE